MYGIVQLKFTKASKTTRGLYEFWKRCSYAESRSGFHKVEIWKNCAPRRRLLRHRRAGNHSALRTAPARHHAVPRHRDSSPASRQRPAVSERKSVQPQRHHQSARSRIGLQIKRNGQANSLPEILCALLHLFQRRQAEQARCGIPRQDETEKHHRRGTPGTGTQLPQRTTEGLRLLAPPHHKPAVGLLPHEDHQDSDRRA